MNSDGALKFLNIFNTSALQFVSSGRRRRVWRYQIHKSKNRQHNDQKKKDKTAIYKTLHIKLKIE